MSQDHIQDDYYDEEDFDSGEEMEYAEEREENLSSDTEKLKEELQTEKDRYLRLFAEFDNFRKRTSKERLDTIKTANSDTLSALLPILDDFERARKEIEKPHDDPFVEGIFLIVDKLEANLIARGLKAMEVKRGDEFNTDTMEAIARIPAPSPELEGKVVDVVQTGYMLNGIELRPCKVVIGA